MITLFLSRYLYRFLRWRQARRALALALQQESARRMVHAVSAPFSQAPLCGACGGYRCPLCGWTGFAT